MNKKWLSELEFEARRTSIDDAKYGQVENVAEGVSTGRTMEDDEENQQVDAATNDNVTNRRGEKGTQGELANEYVNEIHPNVGYDEATLTLVYRANFLVFLAGGRHYGPSVYFLSKTPMQLKLSRTVTTPIKGNVSKDRDTNLYLRGPWAYRVRSEARENLEGGLGDANLCSSIQTDITGKSTLRCTHP